MYEEWGRQTFGCCRSGLSKVLWTEDTTMSTYLVNKGCLNRLRLSAYSWDTVKGTGSMHVLQGDEFELEPQDGHTFEVEPHGSVDHVYREDSNKAAFAVAVVEKIYAHESLTFNNTVACEVIFKWKAGLKDDMDARSDVIHNEKLVQTLWKGHSILSLEGSLSGDCDVEKNAAYMTLTEAAKEAIWLKRHAIKSGFELKIVAGIATGALSKAIPSPRFQHRLNLLSIGIG
ncbi:hypothetical protein Tco_0890985 [Tanacetum coccineum]|uniref:Zinc finger, CCHC-type n=1 Tax=Tanacetum coccineum TaxID=301880 RepID=A0ABQ5C521_9ASTR